MNKIKCLNCEKRYMDFVTINTCECPNCKTICILRWQMTPKYMCDKK